MLWLASALACLVGTRRIATGRATTAQMRISFSSTSEYEQALAAEATLPSGFRVGTAGFRFSPAEAAEGTRATMNLTLIVADAPSSSWAAVFTKNAFCGAPVTVGRNRLAAGGDLQAIVVNNKISNVCSGSDGVGDSEVVCAAAADALSLPGGASSVLPASTGVIGWRLPVGEMAEAIPAAAAELQRESMLPAARAIMTTDRYPKLRRASAAGGSIVGTAKGAGMIEPDMATMLSFVLTDVAVPRAELQRMLAAAADASFNCMSIDADQSTSDSLVLLSSRRVELPAPTAERDEALAEFEAALKRVCDQLAADVARNGEGTTHVLRVAVRGAPSAELARGVGKAVVNSPLIKTAVAGNDPNVGRIVGAVGSFLGKAAPQLDLGQCTMAIGGDTVFEGGSFRLSPAREASLSAHLRQAQQESAPFPPHERFVEVEIDLGAGGEASTVIGSDLTREYVDINADYRS
mmetsp:Transcript_25306/g.81216  ORF Transcript_25306/g.81216 Transcript_25306/m.81216 type:complete len:464 (+) Transcript_25306:85-1476(+)|eukprot:CAMPEP_0185289126 /NCGR_PEP_ID=MMETSP1363-20130426/3750_1 /TAXON_ID=38817 /ORGANISM="Gephyrocapsa oceanica, Strain RCC1303" /LENGTH=463 /DNA_ID=CAMNT_0027885007 /DNA_START=87 /DNA_END=1478 /DNA_ORIENTATION=+